MSGVMEGRMDHDGDGDRGARRGVPDGRFEGGREVRWSARRKQEVVLRLLRGESLDGSRASPARRPARSAAGVRRSWRPAKRG